MPYEPWVLCNFVMIMNLQNHLQKYNSSVLFSLLISLLFAGGICIISQLTPLLVDDWIYRWGSGKSFEEFWTCSGPRIESFRDALQSCLDHYCHTNGRLTDKFFLLFSLYLPAWLSKAICAGSMWIGLLFMLRWTTPKLNLPYPLCTAAVCWFMLIFLPWEDSMMSLACFCNYLLPMGFCMPVIQWFISGKKVCAGGAVLAFLAGTMHESIGLAMLLGMGVLLLRHRFRLSAGQWLTGLCFLAGVLVLMLAPGTFVRIDCAPTHAVGLYWIMGTLTMLPLMFIAALLTVIALCSKKHRSAITAAGATDRMLMLSATALGSVVVAFLSVHRGRALWYGDLLFIPYIFLCVNLLWPKLLKRKSILALLLTAALCGIFTWCAVTQIKFSREARQLAEPDSSQWADVADYSQLSPWQFGLTTPVLAECAYTHISQRFYLRHQHPKYFFAPFPTRFKNIPYTEWDTLPGQSGLYGHFPLYFVPDFKPDPDREQWSATATYDIEHAPLTLYNWPLKLRGIKKLEAAMIADIYRIPRGEMPAEEQQHYADPLTGVVPDTLTFFYLFQLPRPMRGAPAIGRQDVNSH